MSIVSIRLNNDDKKKLDYLTNSLHKDKSTIIKNSLNNLYEDLIDLDYINDFEQEEKEGQVSFISADEIIKRI